MNRTLPAALLAFAAHAVDLQDFEAVNDTDFIHLDNFADWDTALQGRVTEAYGAHTTARLALDAAAAAWLDARELYATTTAAAWTGMGEYLDTRGMPLPDLRTNYWSETTDILPNPMIGFMEWSWGEIAVGPPGANVAIALSKELFAADGLSKWEAGAIEGTKMLGLGGSNSDDHSWTADAFRDIASPATLTAIADQGYMGVLFNIVHLDGSFDDLDPLSRAAFQAVKDAGLAVTVRYSSSGPRGAETPEDAVEWVKSWASDPNVDAISPIISDPSNDEDLSFDLTPNCASAGCTWDLLVGSSARLVPSLSNDSHYDETQAYFLDNYGITTTGYIHGEQVF